MSQRALMLGVRDRLQSAMTLTTATCEVMPDGRPKPIAGDYFIAVHDGGYSGSGNDAGYYYADDYSVQLTITQRIGVYQPDNFGTALTTATTGIEDLAARVRAVLHQDETTRATANTYITGAGVTVDGFLEPLRFRSASPIRLVGAEWVLAYSPYGQETAAPALTITVTMGGAKRYQQISSAST